MSGRAPRVLLLSFQFPPGRGSGIYRIRAWANGLAQSGFDVKVITVDRAFYEQINGSFDDALLDTIDPRVDVRRFRFPAEHMQQRVEKMSWLHASFPDLHAKISSRINDRIFPEAYAPAYPLMVRKGLAVTARWRPDVIVATGNPYCQLAAARSLGRLLRRPYVVDYHDAWTLNQYSQEPAFPPGSPQWDWEQKIINSASLTVTINEPLADWYRKQYPQAADRVRVVENGFDPSVLAEPEWHLVHQPVRFGYVGTIRGDLALEEWAEGWRLARQDPQLAESTFLYRGHVGFFAWNVPAVVKRIQDPDNHIYWEGPFSQTELAAAYADLDVLVLNAISSPYVSSGKLFDYMASGKVVLGLFDRTTQAHEALSGYPLYVPVESMSAPHVAEAVRKAADLARRRSPEDVREAWTVANGHTWDEKFRPIFADLHSIVEGHRI